MKKAKLIRCSDNGTQTRGNMLILDQGGIIVKTFCTIEPPQKNNATNISAIPKGIYICKRQISHFNIRMQKFDVLNVPNRTGIEIHSGNYNSDTKGCILIGNGFKDINMDGHIDISDSHNALRAFNIWMADTFELEIC